MQKGIVKKEEEKTSNRESWFDVFDWQNVSLDGIESVLHESVHSSTVYSEWCVYIVKPQNHYNMSIIWESGERQNDEN